jgi:hypothetical protein
MVSFTTSTAVLAVLTDAGLDILDRGRSLAIVSGPAVHAME